MVRVLAACLIPMLAACAGPLESRIEPPEVTLASLDLGEAGASAKELRLDLRLRNPNEFAIGVEGMTFELAVDGIQFARGQTNHGFNLPALGDTVVPVSLRVPTADLLARAVEFAVQPRLEYRLTGKAEIASMTADEVPFQYQGELALPRIPELAGPAF